MDDVGVMESPQYILPLTTTSYKLQVTSYFEVTYSFVKKSLVKETSTVASHTLPLDTFCEQDANFAFE